MPGHFLVRPTGTQVLLDVFAGGVVLDMAELRGPVPLGVRRGRRGAVRPAPAATATPTPSILVRMLENLRGIYRARRRPADLEWVLRMRLALPGAGLAELLELAGVLGDQARWVEGAAAARAARCPAPPPARAERLRTAAKSLRAHLN